MSGPHASGSDPSVTSATARQHVWDNPRNLRRLLAVFFTVCGLLLLLDFVDVIGKWAHIEWLHFRHESLTVIDGVPGFYAVYGFFGAVTLVLAAKVLRKVVMRPEDYYGPVDLEVPEVPEGPEDVR